MPWPIAGLIADFVTSSTNRDQELASPPRGSGALGANVAKLNRVSSTRIGNMLVLKPPVYILLIPSFFEVSFERIMNTLTCCGSLGRGMHV